jgi:hypothetical protein
VTKIRPYPGRRTLSHVRTPQRTTGQNENKPAGHRGAAVRPPQGRPACYERRVSHGFAISPSSANQFPSPRPDERHHGQQQPRRYLMPRPPALGSAPPAVQSAPRVETVGRSWSIARGTDAAQTVWNDAASPSPTDQDPPGMLGKRTTQAFVAQGIEHRFLTFCAMVLEAAGSEHQVERPRRQFIGDVLLRS